MTQSSPMMFLIHVMVRGSTFGRFQKYWYPQIIHFNRVFYYKPSILGCPYFLETPISTYFNRSTSSVMSLTAHEIALRPGSFAGYLGPWVPLHGHLSRLAAHFTEGWDNPKAVPLGKKSSTRSHATSPLAKARSGPSFEVPKQTV